MIFPTIAVVAGALLVVCDGAALDVLAQGKALREKVAKDFPDAFAKNRDGFVRKVAATPDTTTYTADGWIVQNYYTGASCNAAISSAGYKVDTCYQGNGLGFKYQLTGNSCDGAVRQDFSDTTCTTLDTTTDLNYESGCVSLGVLSYQYTCTSDSSPYLPYQAVVTTYFRDGDCETSTALNAVPPNYCYGNDKTTCSGSQVTAVSYTGDDCSGTATSTTIPSTMCFVDSSDDTADAYYSPGEGATNFELMCSGSNGAASLVNSLGAKAVLAIVLGAVAYMAF